MLLAVETPVLDAIQINITKGESLSSKIAFPFYGKLPTNIRIFEVLSEQIDFLVCRNVVN